MSAVIGRPRPFLDGIFRTACNYCVSSKRGCSGGQPCSHCKKRNKTCAYAQRRKSGPRGHHVDGRSRKGRSRAKGPVSHKRRSPALTEDGDGDENTGRHGSRSPGANGGGDGGPAESNTGSDSSRLEHRRSDQERPQQQQQQHSAQKPSRQAKEKRRPPPCTIPPPTSTSSGQLSAAILVNTAPSWKPGVREKIQIPLPPQPAIVLTGTNIGGDRGLEHVDLTRACSVDNPAGNKRTRLSLDRAPFASWTSSPGLPMPSLPPSSCGVLSGNSSSFALRTPPQTEGGGCGIVGGGPSSRRASCPEYTRSALSAARSGSYPSALRWPVRASPLTGRSRKGSGFGVDPSLSFSEWCAEQAGMALPTWIGDDPGDRDTKGDHVAVARSGASSALLFEAADCGGGGGCRQKATKDRQRPWEQEQDKGQQQWPRQQQQQWPRQQQQQQQQQQAQQRQQQLQEQEQQRQHCHHLQAQRHQPEPRERPQSTREMSLKSLLMSDDEELGEPSECNSNRTCATAADYGNSGAAAASSLPAAPATSCALCPLSGNTDCAQPSLPMLVLPPAAAAVQSHALSTMSSAGGGGSADIVSVSSAAMSPSVGPAPSGSTTGRVSGGCSGSGGGSGGGSRCIARGPAQAAGPHPQGRLPLQLHRRPSDLSTVMMTASWGADATLDAEDGGRLSMRTLAGGKQKSELLLTFARGVSLDHDGNWIEDSLGGGGSDEEATEAALLPDCAALAVMRTPLTREASPMKAVEAAAETASTGGGSESTVGVIGSCRKPSPFSNDPRSPLFREESLLRGIEAVSAVESDHHAAGCGGAAAELITGDGLGDWDSDGLLLGGDASADSSRGDVSVSIW